MLPTFCGFCFLFGVFFGTVQLNLSNGHLVVNSFFGKLPQELKKTL